MSTFIEIYFKWEKPEGKTLKEKLGSCHKVATKNTKLRDQYKKFLKSRFPNSQIIFGTCSDKALVKLEYLDYQI